MSNEQSIRDELAAVIDKEAATYEPVTGFGGTHEPLTLAEGSDMAARIADRVLASPVIRRIQAEALREAADEIAATFTDPDRSRPRHPQAKVSTDYVNDPQWAELIVRNRAGTIERGEQS